MKFHFLSLFLLLIGLTACEIEERPDPNAPILDGVLMDATPVELSLLATGTEAGMREGYASYVTATGTIARELYIFDADPRNTGDLLGKKETSLDNNTFYITGPFNSRYRVVKNANILLGALDNTMSVTDAEKQGYRGFANTLKAYMLSQVLDMLGDNGIRFDVSDVDALGPFLSREASYDAILGLLDEAFTQLEGSTFAFAPSSGFSGLDSPETFQLFNRAIAARVATRAGRYQAALAYVDSSFLNLKGDLSFGARHPFSTGPGDLLNPLFKPAGQSGDQLVVHPRIIENATEGDARLNKFRLRMQTAGQDGLSGQYETALYESATSPIDIIRNEELVLIYAEANINLGNLEEGITALNVIRNAAGLGDYDGATTQEALIDELLYQRCYSLWGEGHRMFDLRRYGRLNADFLPLDREGDDIFIQFPIPLSEGV